MRLVIPEALLNKILSQAEREYPNECCGLLLGTARNPNELSLLIACRNAQDDYHQKEPLDFPRTARTAYFIEPLELLKIQKSARKNGKLIRVIYHSHVDSDSHFSEEDKRLALCGNEPAYPEAAYLVVSVRQGKACGHSLFYWNPDLKNFVCDS